MRISYLFDLLLDFSLTRTIDITTRSSSFFRFFFFFEYPGGMLSFLKRSLLSSVAAEAAKTSRGHLEEQQLSIKSSN